MIGGKIRRNIKDGEIRREKNERIIRIRA